jgi:lipoprotein-releasing system permease protein
MFYPLIFYIGLRYTRAKRRNHFISFISLASMIGLALGVAVLITVMSVMNGFDFEIHDRIFSMAQQVMISGSSGYLDSWQKLSDQVGKEPNVVASSPYVVGQGMVSSPGNGARAVLVDGILPDYESKVSGIYSNMVAGKLDALKPGEFDIVIGQDLAMSLGASVGDKIMLITPEATATLVGVMPRFKRFNVVGIFHVGDGFGYDSNVVYMHLNDAQKLFKTGKYVSSLRLKVKSLYDAPKVAAELKKTLGNDYFISDWTSEYGAYFKAIRMEKTTMFVVLMFIIAVAAFNLVSSLVMTVTDKRSDIAILRTIGASPKTVMGIFMVQGTVIGFMGTLLGILGGIVLALNAPAIVSGIEHYFNVHFISASIYFINYLPSKLDWFDVVHIGLASLVMSLLATIYPAWRASQIQPAEALRYE